MTDLIPEPEPRVALVADDLGPGDIARRVLSDLHESGIAGWQLDDRHYELVHAFTPGPAGLSALNAARAARIPVVSNYHATTYERISTTYERTFYSRCDLVLSPTGAADRSLAALGVQLERVARWEPGVDRTRFSPSYYGSEILPRAFNVLFVGRLARESGIELLAEAFLLARERDPRLHLVLVGRGPDEERLRVRLGAAASFLGWLDGEPLSRVYASADLLVFVDGTNVFGQPMLDAQASGLPTLAREDCAAAGLIENGRNGCLVAPEPHALGERDPGTRPARDAPGPTRDRWSGGSRRALPGAIHRPACLGLHAGTRTGRPGGRGRACRLSRRPPARRTHSEDSRSIFSHSAASIPLSRPPPQRMMRP